MSVVVTIRIPVADVSMAVKGLHDNAEFLEEITASTINDGMIHHRFVTGGNELMVIDEWETAEQFQKFFEGNPKVAEVMVACGMNGDPEISVFGALDIAGDA